MMLFKSKGEVMVHKFINRDMCNAQKPISNHQFLKTLVFFQKTLFLPHLLRHYGRIWKKI